MNKFLGKEKFASVYLVDRAPQAGLWDNQGSGSTSRSVWWQQIKDSYLGFNTHVGVIQL